MREVQEPAGRRAVERRRDGAACRLARFGPTGAYGNRRKCNFKTV